jgi:hypothetical protein
VGRVGYVNDRHKGRRYYLDILVQTSSGLMTPTKALTEFKILLKG